MNIVTSLPIQKALNTNETIVLCGGSQSIPQSIESLGEANGLGHQSHQSSFCVSLCINYMHILVEINYITPPK